MKRTLLYLAIAVFLGLLIMLVPLTALVGLDLSSYPAAAGSLPEGFREIEGSRGVTAAKISFYDFEVPLISFVFAIAAYLLSKRRIS